MKKKANANSKEEKDNILIGKKTKRHYSENPTNDSSFPNNIENESERSLISENSQNKSIYVTSLNKIQKSNLENIFNAYGKIEKIITNKKSAVITFSKKKSAKSIIDNKANIYEKYKLKVGYKSNEYDNTSEKENEANKEESEKEDEFITTREKSQSDKNKKMYYERKSKESVDSKIDNSIGINNDKTNIKSEFSEKLLSLEETINKLIEHDNALSNTMNKIREENNNLKGQIIEIKKRNTKIVKLLGIMGEINIQKEKYISTIEFKLELVLNSYKIIYIRKLANIILSEIFKKYNSHFKNKQTSCKNYLFTVCVKSIKGINRDIITLIVDFLRYIKYRISQIIHIQDDDIKFNREILCEYLDTSTSIDKDSFTIKEASTLIFNSDIKKEKKFSEESKERYKKLNSIIKKQLKKYDEEEEEEEQKHQVSEGEEDKEDEENEEGEEEDEEEVEEDEEDEEEVEEDEEDEEEVEEDEEDEEEEDYDEEKRIKNILKGDEKYINMSIKVQIKQLLKIIKKNQLEEDNKYYEIKKIDGKFLYEEWKNSFSKEHFKKDDLFLQYVHPHKSPSLENIGYYINIMLEDLRVNFNEVDPNPIEQKIKKKNIKKFRKKNKKKLRK